MTVIRHWVVRRDGHAVHVFDHPDDIDPADFDFGDGLEVVEVVSAEQLRGAVERAEKAEAALLLRTGHFRWGKDSWIHRDDEGTVMSTADALASIGGQ